MSAWYLFSALGFYPVDPVSGNYIVGSYVYTPVYNRHSSKTDHVAADTRPFFDSVKINFPNAKKPLEIISKGAPRNPYVKSLSVNGKSVQKAVITHKQIAQGGTIKFEMSSRPEAWASGTLVG
jgi:putative alpha-1,2-mannosidase